MAPDQPSRATHGGASTTMAQITLEERAPIQKFLSDHFSLDDLKTLALDIGVNYEDLPHGTIGKFSRELTRYADRLWIADKLIRQALEERSASAPAQRGVL